MMDLHVREGANPTRKGGVLMPEFTTGRRAHRAYNWRVWWIPDVPDSKQFFVECPTPEFALRTMEVLAQYDLYLYHNGNRADYSNAGGIQRWDPEQLHDGLGPGRGGWEDVEYDEELGEWQ